MSVSSRRNECVARAQREAFAEEADRHVVAAAAACGRQRHLVRPLPIHRAFAEFSLAIDHGTSRDWSPPALDATCRGTGDAFAELAGGVRGVYQR